MKKEKTVYFNTKQIEFATAPQRIKCLVGGRGFGKSAVLSLITYNWMRAMPRAKVFLASTTFDQITDATMAVVRDKWAELGLIEDVHYVIGKRPPEKWLKPYKPPAKYERVITFFNGFSIVFLSAERMKSRRGRSFDAGIVDEAGFVKYSAFKSVFSASIRGNIGLFPKSVHRSLVILTSRPRDFDGRWVYLFRELAKKKPDQVLYMEASALDNKAALGQEWFEDQREQIGDELEYLIEILNQDVGDLPNGFYNKYKSHLHEYIPTRDVRGHMTDVDPSALWDLSVDYGGWFSCFTCFQQDWTQNVERLKRRYWIKTDNIENLVDAFCEDNKGHHFKYVRLWGEPRMWDRTARGKIAVTIVRRMAHHGWQCDVLTPPGYKTELLREQYQFMLKVLERKDELIPGLLVNSEACADTITAIKLSDVLPDMGLDKGNEKNRAFPQEHATHQPQTINYYFIQKHGEKIAQEHEANAQAGEFDLV